MFVSPALALITAGAITRVEHRAALAELTRTSSRVPDVKACAADDDVAKLEAKLKDAITREDYKAAAVLKVQLEEAVLAAPVPVKSMYESLQRRSALLVSRRDTLVRERELVRKLDASSTQGDEAIAGLWEHWFGEYGEKPRERLLAADGDAAALLDIMDEFPDWVEPPNRLATLLYMEGEFSGSVDLCQKILRQKPWHFGAASGIVMCYAKLGDVKKANECAAEAMPRPGPARAEWVERMVSILDARLAELDEIGGVGS